MILAVTNCIAYEANIGKSRLYRGRFHHSLLTDALIRLIGGETLYPKREKDDEYNFEPININDIETILWSPFIDQAGYYANIKNWDGTLFPYSDGLTCPKYGIVGHVPLSTVYLWWQEFDRITSVVPKRVMLVYPSKFLAEEPNKNRKFDGLDLETYYKRIADSDKKALEIFKDWQILTVENPVLGSDNWWAHFTHESRLPLLKKIEEICG